MKRGASDLSNSSDGTKKRKLDNWLLNLSYQHIGIYSCIVLLLCLVSFAVPVLDAVIAASGDVQACLCGCGSGGPGAPAVWYYVAAGLTGLVNVLAIISVALGIYSVAEARAASEENAETCLRIERIDDEMEDLLPKVLDLQKHVGGTARRMGSVHRSMQAMLLQMERLQAGMSRLEKKLDTRLKQPVGYGDAQQEADDFGIENIDRIDS